MTSSNQDDTPTLFELPALGEHGLPAGLLPAQRLVDMIGGARAAAEVFGLDVRSIQRWTYWSYARADAMAIRAGLHPAEVWPSFKEVD